MRPPRFYYVWQPKGKSVAVHLNLDVIDRLNDASPREPQSTAGRAVERGGVLLGTVQKDANDTWVVGIDDFELFPSEHIRGPSFSLSGWDRKRLARRVAQFKSRKNYTVVGYFRDHTRPGLYLDEEDASVVASHFSEPWSVVLLVRPNAGQASAGGFFFWEEGDMRRHSCYLLFPFDRRQLESGDFSILKLEPPEPARSFSRRGFKVKLRFAPRWLWVPVAAAGLIVLTALWQLTVWKPAAPVNAAAELGLRATRDGDSWRISWNRSLPAIQHADRAALWISDAGKRERLELDRNQLTTGSIGYWPLGNDVNFRLEIFSQGQHMTESLRTLAPRSQTAPRVTLKREVVQPAVTAPGRELPVRKDSLTSTLNTHAGRQPTPGLEVTAAPPKHQTGIAAKTEPVNHQPEEAAAAPETAVSRSDTSAEVSIPAPPVAAPEKKLEVLEKSERKAETLAALRAERRLNRPSPPVEVSVEPVPPSSFRRAMNKIPVLRALQRHGYKAGERFVPAKPVRKVAPTVPALGRELSAEVSIDLKVSIDKSGRVSRTELLSDKGDTELLSLAEDAARRWEFEPARLDEEPVSSEVILHFKFRNP